MACQGSSYTRTAKRSLGVYDLIAAGEGRELTSRYSALEQSDRTHGPSTQASQHYTNPNKQGRLPRRMPRSFDRRFTETPYNNRHKFCRASVSDANPLVGSAR